MCFSLLKNTNTKIRSFTIPSNVKIDFQMKKKKNKSGCTNAIFAHSHPCISRLAEIRIFNGLVEMLESVNIKQKQILQPLDHKKPVFFLFC